MKNICFIAGFILLIFIIDCKDFEFNNTYDPASPQYITPKTLIDNFDDGDKINFFGFPYNTFKDSGEIVATRIDDPEIVLSGTGYSVKIEFDVSSDTVANPSCGWVEPVVKIDVGGDSEQGYDLTALDVKYVTFWIKRESEGINMEIALRDIDEVQTSPKVLLRKYCSSSTNWQKIIIPISDLVLVENDDTVNLRKLKEFNIGFNRKRFESEGGDLKGVLYIDEIGFER